MIEKKGVELTPMNLLECHAENIHKGKEKTSLLPKSLVVPPSAHSLQPLLLACAPFPSFISLYTRGE